MNQISRARLVIGFGNPLHGDDGFAAEVCRRLNAQALPADLRVCDAGTRGLDALALLTDCASAILLDAQAPQPGDPQPGRVRELDLAALQTMPDPSGHLSGVAWVVQALQATQAHQPRLRLLTAEAADQRTFSMRLSAPMQAAVDQVVQQLRTELALYG